MIALEATPMKLLGLNLLGVNLTILLGTVLSFFVSWYVGIAASILSGLGLVVWGARARLPSLLYAALVAMIGGVLCGMHGSELRSLRRGETLREVTLSRAIEHAGAAAFTFTDAQVMTRFTTSHHATGGTRGGRGRYHYLAPIVESSWQQGQPIQVWAVCGEVAACREGWEFPWKAALNLSHQETEDLPSYQKAVRAAEARFGIASHPRALFARWVVSPEHALAEGWGTMRMAALFWNLAWLIPWALWRLVASLRARSKP